MSGFLTAPRYIKKMGSKETVMPSRRANETLQVCSDKGLTLTTPAFPNLSRQLTYLYELQVYKQLSGIHF